MRLGKVRFECKYLAIQFFYNEKHWSINWMCKVLGVSPDATDDEVRKAYRKMVIQHHPDKVSNLGEDVKEAATKKLQEINKAKEMIFQARGLS